MPANRTVDVLSMPEDVCKACLGRILAQLPDEGLRLRPLHASERSWGCRNVAFS